MPFLFRKSVRFGPYRANLSKSGVSHTLKIGPVSTNSRQRRIRVDLPGPFAWTSQPFGRHRSGARAKRSRGRQIALSLLFAVLVIAPSMYVLWVR
jgi:hypothetical protein